MKKVFTKIFLLSALTCGLAFRSGDVLTDLKLSSELVGEQVFDQLTAEHPVLRVPYESRQIARQFSSAARTMSVRALYPVVRNYVQSDGFRKRYDAWLRSKYQVEEGDEVPETPTSENLRAAQNAQLTQILETFSKMSSEMLALMLPQQMNDIQQQLRYADAPQKSALTRDLTVLRELQPLSSSRPAEFKTRYLEFMKGYLARQMGQGVVEEEERQMQARERAEDYRRRLVEYRANANPDLALKKELREFIALAESVDFDAEVLRQGSRTEFVRADYRNKPSEWKQLYRLGREPVLVARDLARTWLSELK